MPPHVAIIIKLQYYTHQQHIIWWCMVNIIPYLPKSKMTLSQFSPQRVNMVH